MRVVLISNSEMEALLLLVLHEEAISVQLVSA